ncbi:SDR family NAD(P)-dependent oxidoreductase [Anaeromyxobacter diazotrophicus]|uniref:Short-chain dehydrogenase n=1 Tax=Anaeromyxobacter diazotrophicus TaxID=2590199 RepID=A0A7I9VRD3_9BACT|nr:SDR family NAD(P)-dependent oxidoreductase [Anaeromyxobacter diazotrophicus]GEJ58975.1 short-chain dehydrogenase [Anaeromyxobacter diazotrophicus]
MAAFQPKSVFITGASSGLGRGLALHYARAGATVHAAARRQEALAGLADEVARASLPGLIVPVALDVTDAEAQARAIAAAEEAAGGALDLVVANAGVGEPTPATRMDWRRVKRVLDVNVSAACVTVAAALPAMVARGEGTVVAVASLAALRGLPGSAAYCASKAALHTFMEGVRVDLRGSGVRALTLYPGFVKTEMTAKNRFPMPFLMELDDAVEVMAAGIARGEPALFFPRGLAAAVRALGALPRALYEPLAGLGRRR